MIFNKFKVEALSNQGSKYGKYVGMPNSERQQLPCPIIRDPSSFPSPMPSHSPLLHHLFHCARRRIPP